jgi:Tat protein secretion system quality control protein TatD with DNase activity
MVIDSHCHLHDPVFADLKETLRLSMAHDVWGAIAVGCDPETNAQTLEAAAAAPKAVWACLGFHPDRTELTDEDLERDEAQSMSHLSRKEGKGELV